MAKSRGWGGKTSHRQGIDFTRFGSSGYIELEHPPRTGQLIGRGDPNAVHPHICFVIDAIEAQRKSFAFVLRRDVEFGPIPPGVPERAGGGIMRLEKSSKIG